jgi:DNA-binding NarL/FixJ family response regulator
VSKSAIGQLRTSAKEKSQGTVALIADENAHDEILAVLHAQDLCVEEIDGPENLPTDDTNNHRAIVLWAGDTVAALSKSIERLARHFHPTPVVVVCSSIHRWEVRTALTAGAAGVVAYEDLTETLGPCILAVATGQTCVPRDQWRQVEPPALSSREKQILGLVVMGYMNSQIAERLFLAESTVKSHLSSAFGKLGVRSRNEAVNLIIDPERGLGMGILGLSSEPLEPISTGTP